MNCLSFNNFFQGAALDFLLRAIRTALEEDGVDLTSNAVFSAEHSSKVALVAKEDSLVAGLPAIPLIMTEAEKYASGRWSYAALVEEGVFVPVGTTLAHIAGPTRLLLKAERIIINFTSQMSGVANLTARYVKALQGTNTRLLDTRKTLPGMRYPQKYAVLVGGGHNHRFSLEDMLMLKDNHIDAAGSIGKAVTMLRDAYKPCPPIEVECRNEQEVVEAVSAKVDRIMLDNMDAAGIGRSMAIIPEHIETEVSGGVNLENIAQLVKAASEQAGFSRCPTFVSVGRLTHSAPVADFSICFIS
ncbi:MAG: carboxylating nicotinate-nucleotide diphosphorylase [Deltaproteobacteria bacterium]|jgi:nicotinate-nucleotide pyrophosphorylase (carboxylating)|nr:carboxylating nicotinate-nucleotide diphosphorylase [Deltaproteobacteria bacterium]